MAESLLCSAHLKEAVEYSSSLWERKFRTEGFWWMEKYRSSFYNLSKYTSDHSCQNWSCSNILWIQGSSLFIRRWTTNSFWLGGEKREEGLKLYVRGEKTAKSLDGLPTGIDFWSVFNKLNSMRVNFIFGILIQNQSFQNCCMNYFPSSQSKLGFRIDLSTLSRNKTQENKPLLPEE